jgi:hypothetical protein
MCCRSSPLPRSRVPRICCRNSPLPRSRVPRMCCRNSPLPRSRVPRMCCRNSPNRWRKLHSIRLRCLRQFLFRLLHQRQRHSLRRFPCRFLHRIPRPVLRQRPRLFLIRCLHNLLDNFPLHQCLSYQLRRLGQYPRRQLVCRSGRLRICLRRRHLHQGQPAGSSPLPIEDRPPIPIFPSRRRARPRLFLKCQFRTRLLLRCRFSR